MKITVKVGKSQGENYLLLGAEKEVSSQASAKDIEIKQAEMTRFLNKRVNELLPSLGSFSPYPKTEEPEKMTSEQFNAIISLARQGGAKDPEGVFTKRLGKSSQEVTKEEASSLINELANE